MSLRRWADNCRCENCRFWHRHQVGMMVGDCVESPVKILKRATEYCGRFENYPGAQTVEEQKPEPKTRSRRDGAG